jgi:two-component system, cell cycle sensor histidine kinase and response regulator CckA
MILVVDDCDMVRRYIGAVLRRLGFSVIEAANGGEAAEVSRRHTGPIDLLVMDVELPDAAGLDVAQQLFATRPELAVLYISGYSRDVLGEGVLPPGTGFLQKPFTSDALVLQVREALRKRDALSDFDSGMTIPK